MLSFRNRTAGMIAERTLLRSLAAVLLFTGVVFSQSVGSKQYPYCTIAPDTPCTIQDTIMVREMIGVAANSCVAPKTIAESFTIEEVPTACPPQQFNIRLFYKALPVDTICPDVYNPVPYGVSFKVGPLKTGRYTVIDNGKIAGMFRVIEKKRGNTIAGVVIDDPLPVKRAGVPLSSVQVILKKRLATGVPAPSEFVSSTGSYIEIAVDTMATDSGGVFTFSNLTSGTYALYCSHPSYHDESVSIALSSDTTMTLVLLSKNASASIAGVVSEIVSVVNGGIVTKPVEACSVTVTRAGVLAPSSSESLKNVFKTVTNSAGSFSVSQIPLFRNNERWTVSASKPGYSTETKTVALVNQEALTVNIDLQKLYSNRRSDTVQGLIFTIASDKELYSINDGVIIQYSITNGTANPVTMQAYRRNCEYDFAVLTNSKRTLFRLSDVATCTADPAPSAITINPNVTITKVFPTYYIPDVNSDIPEGGTVPLYLYTRVRGQKYDSSEVWLPISVQKAGTALRQQPRAALPAAIDVRIARRGVIEVTLSEQRTVALSVFSLDGKLCRNLSFSQNLKAGSHFFTLSSSVRQPPRTYIARVAATGFFKTFLLQSDCR
jgi:hypothetical protein